MLQHSPGQAASKSCWLTCFILKTPKILCVFAQDVPCKFAIALGFENNTCKESSDINWCIKQPNAFMSSLLQKMLIRVYLTSHQLEINSLPSFIGPRWWKSKITQKLKLDQQVLWKHTFYRNNHWSTIVSVGNLRWLDTVFQGQYLPSLSINYVAKNKVLEKLPPQLY